MCTIIPRNTMLPCSIIKRFYTSRDNQTKVEIEIAQGEHVYVKDNIILDKMVVNVPKNKRGEESIDVRYTYDINGILIADVTVISTGQTISKVLSQTMNQNEIEKKMKELEVLKVHPKDINENRILMEQLIAKYEQATLDTKDVFANLISHFEVAMESQNARKVKKAKEYIEKVLPQLESYDPFADVFDFKKIEENIGVDDEDMDFSEDEDFYVIENGEKKWTS